MFKLVERIIICYVYFFSFFLFFFFEGNEKKNLTKMILEDSFSKEHYLSI